MKSLVGLILVGGIAWQDMGDDPRSADKTGIVVTFNFSSRMTPRESIDAMQAVVKQNNIGWLQFSKPNWRFSSEKFKRVFPQYSSEEWLQGDFFLELEHDIRTHSPTVGGGISHSTFCRFYLTPEIIMDQRPKKIFLSHKSVNKELVRDFKNALKIINLDPWLDEDDMPAGIALHRGIREGFRKSCAAVFFITPEFKDESFLADEIDYAKQEKTEKKERFAIITLVFKGQDGNKGKVPELLKQFVYKEPKSDLQAFVEIIRALPLQIPEAIWKENIGPNPSPVPAQTQVENEPEQKKRKRR